MLKHINSIWKVLEEMVKVKYYVEYLKQKCDDGWYTNKISASNWIHYL